MEDHGIVYVVFDDTEEADWVDYEDDSAPFIRHATDDGILRGPLADILSRD